MSRNLFPYTSRQTQTLFLQFILQIYMASLIVSIKPEFSDQLNHLIILMN